MGEFPKLHPRVTIVNRAAADIRLELLKALEGKPWGTILGWIADTIKESPKPSRIPKATEVLIRVRVAHDLTNGEVLSILAEELADAARMLIRYERHGNYEERGGEA